MDRSISIYIYANKTLSVSVAWVSRSEWPSQLADSCKTHEKRTTPSSESPTSTTSAETSGACVRSKLE